MKANPVSSETCILTSVAIAFTSQSGLYRGLVAHIKAIAPQASFLVWLDCQAMGLAQDELMRFFTEKAGLLLSSGTMYGQGGEGFVRINMGCPRKIVKEEWGKMSFFNKLLVSLQH